MNIKATYIQKVTFRQRIWAIGLMESLFCVWDDLLRLFATARVANPKIGLRLVLNLAKSPKAFLGYKEYKKYKGNYL
jgi:hypothetical protein